MSKHLLQFKRTPETPELEDTTGFVWLPGYEKEVDEQTYQKLMRHYPKNFVDHTPPAIKSLTVEDAPDKMISEDKPKTKKK
jgi:hypothetical protein